MQECDIGKALHSRSNKIRNCLKKGIQRSGTATDCGQGTSGFKRDKHNGGIMNNGLQCQAAITERIGNHINIKSIHNVRDNNHTYQSTCKFKYRLDFRHFEF